MAIPMVAAAGLAAYRAAQDALDPAAGAAPGAAAGGPDFGATLQRALDSAVQVGRSADAASTQALLGHGSVTDVVMAVSKAELALQSVVTVRDKVIGAYQEIMRMPI